MKKEKDKKNQYHLPLGIRHLHILEILKNLSIGLANLIKPDGLIVKPPAVEEAVEKQIILILGIGKKSNKIIKSRKYCCGCVMCVGEV